MSKDDITRREESFSETKSFESSFTRREENISAGVGNSNVNISLYPGAIFLDYVLISPLNVASGEADLWVVAKEGREYVLKLYRYGIKPKEEIWHKLKSLDQRHVVGTIEQGSFGNRYYEVLEKMNGGDLRSVKKPCTDEYLKLIVSELFASVSYLHEKGIIHRDLKPANILIRSNDPLELVIADFGIASLSEGNNDLKLTSTDRTVSYSAPEALAGVVSNMSDWWSIGVIVLEYLKGFHPFQGINEQLINLQLMEKGIRIPLGISTEWTELLKGLLTRDRDRRWGPEQVKRWLNGERNQITFYEADKLKKSNITPYKFNGKDIYTVEDLADELSKDWVNAEKHLNRGFISKWIETEIKDQDLIIKIGDILEPSSEIKYASEEKLALVLRVLSENIPLTWKGLQITPDFPTRQYDEYIKIYKSNIFKLVYFDYFKKHAESGNASSQFALAKCCGEGVGVNKDEV